MVSRRADVSLLALSDGLEEGAEAERGLAGSALGGLGTGELGLAGLVEGGEATPGGLHHAEGTGGDGLVGAAADGVTPMGNGRDGVCVLDISNGTIGGIDAGAGNVIAFNGGGTYAGQCMRVLKDVL